MSEEKPFVPTGSPVGLAQLLGMAAIARRDVEEAIRTANPQIRKYLKAKVYGPGSR